MKKFSQSAFAGFFTRFPKLLLSGLLFSVPFAIFMGLFLLICYLCGFTNNYVICIIVAGLGIIPAFPFYSGLVMTVRKYAVDKQEVKVIPTFFDAVKDNCKRFLIHGAVTYVIAACGFFALLYYYSLAKDDIVFGYVLTLYMLFVALLIIMMFYVPLMTVTYELRMTDIYKNSFLLIFGKILRSLAALLLVAVLTGAAFLALMFSRGAWLVISAVLIAALYPMIATYIIVSVVSKGMRESVGEFIGVTAEEPEEDELQDEQLAVENADSGSDYVFVNGRMIKRHKEDDENALPEQDDSN